MCVLCGWISHKGEVVFTLASEDGSIKVHDSSKVRDFKSIIRMGSELVHLINKPDPGTRNAETRSDILNKEGKSKTKQQLSSYKNVSSWGVNDLV